MSANSGDTLTPRPINERCAPVANIRSQIKRNRQNEVRRQRNRAIRSELRTRTKNALEAAKTEKNSEETAIAMRHLDKAGLDRIIHPNAAARRKSRLQKRLNRFSD